MHDAHNKMTCEPLAWSVNLSSSYEVEQQINSKLLQSNPTENNEPNAKYIW
jgi:hypothetical protein